MGGCLHTVLSFLILGLTSGHHHPTSHLRELRLRLGEVGLKADAVVTSVGGVHEADFLSLFSSASSKISSKQLTRLWEIARWPHR